VKTRLGLSPDRAAELHEALVRDTLAGLQELAGQAEIELSTDVPTGAWPEFVLARSEQARGDLGARMFAAIQAALARERPKVVILGSDSPQLPPGHIRALLGSNADVAIGPTDDGGYYAIACRRASPGMFDGVRWSTEHAFSDTVSAVGRCGLTWEAGPSWFDVDRPEDLHRPEVRCLVAGSPRYPPRASASGVFVSIVIPALNESACISDTIRALAKLDGEKEIVVADGGSDDGTAGLASALGARVVACERGRGEQMRAAAATCRGDVLWFVHADTLPPANALAAICDAFRDDTIVAGNFALKFAGNSRAARNLTWIYPYLRILGLAYGDSGVFVRRSVYERIGGFRAYPLFEDLDLIRRVRRAGRFVRLDCELVTSARRFEDRYLRSWVLWITLQVLYWLGVPPTALARMYRHMR
jgi:rSAM/selenodomain-associated transferase 2